MREISITLNEPLRIVGEITKLANIKYFVYDVRETTETNLITLASVAILQCFRKNYNCFKIAENK